MKGNPVLMKEGLKGMKGRFMLKKKALGTLHLQMCCFLI